MIKENDTLDLVPAPSAPLAPAAASPIAILEAAIKGGVTQENVSVVKELIQMCREQRAEDAKAAFAKAFFNLRKNMPELYADKEGKNDAGVVCFRYCSETEISKMVEPHLMKYGFAMLFGQSQEEGRITVNVTLMHEAGHSETREYTVRPGKTNRMKDDTMADAGGATTAWRHLIIKMFGLKSRIMESYDAKLEGEKIGPDKVQFINELLAETKSDVTKFLAMAGADKVENILSGNYDVLVRALTMKRRA